MLIMTLRTRAHVVAAAIGSAALLLAAPAVLGATYHVDCRAGSDGAAGTTADAAWKTVEKVSATVFAPGDAVLFRRGTRCSGMLSPRGSGNDARPIRIGSYGEGAPPVIDGGKAPAALRLFNQQGWHIENIEAVGGSPHGIYIGGDTGRWTLTLFAAVSREDARSQLVFLETAMAQYGDSRLTAVVAGTGDWPLEKVRSVAADASGTGVLLSLSSPSGKVVREWRAFATPADLGLTLRHALGPPRGSGARIP